MNTEKQVNQTAQDFLISGLQDGHIGEQELAQWIVEGLTNDTDAVKRLIGMIAEEQADYVLDFYDDLETGDLNKEMTKLDHASRLPLGYFGLEEFNSDNQNYKNE